MFDEIQVEGLEVRRFAKVPALLAHLTQPRPEPAIERFAGYKRALALHHLFDSWRAAAMNSAALSSSRARLVARTSDSWSRPHFDAW